VTSVTNAVCQCLGSGRYAVAFVERYAALGIRQEWRTLQSAVSLKICPFTARPLDVGPRRCYKIYKNDYYRMLVGKNWKIRWLGLKEKRLFGDFLTEEKVRPHSGVVSWRICCWSSQPL
jgi:hypothetical protein